MKGQRGQETNSELSRQVQRALDELLPAMTTDGGGAELTSLEAGVATVRLIGSCEFCPSRKLSASALQRGLEQRVPELVSINILYPTFSQSAK